MSDILIRAHSGDPWAERFVKHNRRDHRWDRSWAGREPYSHFYRCCSFCGSLHPHDLLEVIKKHEVTLESADWKYGWPHKFYVNGIPNANAGRKVQCGSRSGPAFDDNGEPNLPDLTIIEKMRGRYDRKIIDDAPATCHAKFYNLHFLDLVDTPQFEELRQAIFERTGIDFNISEGQLAWRRV